MTIDSKLTPRIICGFLAVLITAAVHGGWLSGMDRDAVAVIQQA
jgi:hypothetical protein